MSMVLIKKIKITKRFEYIEIGDKHDLELNSRKKYIRQYLFASCDNI